MPVKARRRPVATDRRFRNKNNGSDFGTRERWQHSGQILELTEQAGVLAARTLNEHIVDSMVTLRLLTATQSAAAFRFKLDFQRAGLAPARDRPLRPLAQRRRCPPRQPRAQR